MSRSSILPSLSASRHADDGADRSAGSRRCRRSSCRGRPRCAWRSRSRLRATAARPSPSRADTCAPDRRCGRYRRHRRLPRASPSPSSASALGRLLALLALDDVDAELGEHRHRVLDLLRGHLVLRQRGVQLVIGQIAALLAARHHLLDRRSRSCRGAGLQPLLPGFRPYPPLSPLCSPCRHP